MRDITFEPTKTERTDASKQVVFNREPEHEARIEAHCTRVQRDYFDSGLFYEEMHSAQGGSINETHTTETARQRERRQVKRWIKSMEKLQTTTRG